MPLALALWADIVYVSVNPIFTFLHQFYLGRFAIFFISGFSFTDTNDSQDRKGREGTIFYFTLPFPPAYEH